MVNHIGVLEHHVQGAGRVARTGACRREHRPAAVLRRTGFVHVSSGRVERPGGREHADCSAAHRWPMCRR
ncbi:hypothetical protein [Kineococcus sp. SYSU DK003]|uniref:hypothetical protein n=1 Tax=Kineococcus sp. SYSU DK003 TaxID=3383124 RepID=UPI003D7D8798